MIAISIEGATIGKWWTSLNGGTNWTYHSTQPTVGGRTLNMQNLFMIPCESVTWFATGALNSGSGVAMPLMTKDYGTNFTDISLYGQTGALDTVLNLAAGDMATSFIVVDYYRV